MVPPPEDLLVFHLADDTGRRKPLFLMNWWLAQAGEVRLLNCHIRCLPEQHLEGLLVDGAG